MEEVHAAHADWADRLDESEQFLAMAVHELRSPAATLLGAASTLGELVEDLALPPAARDLLDMIERSGERMTQLIADLLTSAYLERGLLPLRAADVPLRPIIRWAVEGAGAAAKGVEIHCDPALHAHVDADRLEQIVTNLVGNGFDHGAAPVTVAVDVDGSSGIRIVVRDHGAGVGAEDAAHLFGRFSPLAARRSTSTGLGLSIARALARAMGGDIVYVRADPGSQFVVLLPAAA